MDIAAKLREFREYYRASQAVFREQHRRKNEALNRWLGVRKPRTMTGIALFIHAVVATGLYVGSLCWLVVEFAGREKEALRGAILLPFLLPAVYLYVVHVFVRKSRRGEK